MDRWRGGVVRARVEAAAREGVRSEEVAAAREREEEERLTQVRDAADERLLKDRARTGRFAGSRCTRWHNDTGHAEPMPRQQRRGTAGRRPEVARAHVLVRGSPLRKLPFAKCNCPSQRDLDSQK